MTSHATALNAVNECSQRGGLHGHALLYCALNPALLQGSADIQELCDAVTDVLDSIFRATLPRQYHVKYLIEKELSFYPTNTNHYEKVVRRGRAMLVCPDPTNKAEFDDFVHTSICSFGIHSHDRSIAGRCHKPPKGINQCSLSKPSGLVETTKPVQLLDYTAPSTLVPKEKATIMYEVTDKIQSRE